MTRRALPESGVGVFVRSLDTLPLNSRSGEQNFSLRIPTGLIDVWGVEPGKARIYFRAHHQGANDQVTVISPNVLVGGDHQLLARTKKVVIPSSIPNEFGGVGLDGRLDIGMVVAWNPESPPVAVVGRPPRIAQRLGGIAFLEVSDMTEADEKVMDTFTETVASAPGRSDVILPADRLHVDPVDLMRVAFPEILSSAGQQQ
jgi:hypothetical protein